MSRIFLYFLCFFLVILSLVDERFAQLRPGGRNVCSRSVVYNTYQTRSDRRIGYDNYRTCCKRKWGICTSRCTRTRTKWVTYYKNVLVPSTRYVYECCKGWAKSHQDCPTPICSPGCVNGLCASPNNCQCRNGFEGNICQSDINECSRSSPCSQICNNLHGTYACSCRRGFKKAQKAPTSSTCSDINECSRNPCSCASNARGCLATCVNTVGSYHCQCNKGFKLVGKISCIDINECISSSMNSCEQTCHNIIGSYRCTCKKGYLIKPDGFGCSDVNECKTLNGGCQQTCVNSIGSYHCRCSSGFLMLPDKRRCKDIDECTSKLHSCDKLHGICNNTQGSYKCSCTRGYALQKDQKTCKDINECLNKTTHKCAQNCHNTDGSYKCSCRKGFRLNSDGYSCQDIDECKERSHKCQQICMNTISAYICKCRQGYELKKDTYTCRALPCETLTAPRNGEMKCNGFVTDKFCTFSCNQGFYLTGSSNRTCLPTSVWNGKSTICLPKPCPNIQPPQYGSVVLPCVEKFNSTCLLKCNRRFYMSGGNIARCIVDNGITKWQQSNTTCKAATLCKPNPCKHDGKCKDEGFKKYSCDCSNTGYIGKHCEKGLIIRPKYSKLIVGERSKMLYFDANPENEIIITPLVSNKAAFINPSFVRITYPRRRAAFYVTSQKVGLLKIKYKITGPDAAKFLSLPTDRVYSSFKYKTKMLDIGIDFYRDVCHPIKRISCPNGQKVQIFGSCKGKQSVSGFVSLITDRKDVGKSNSQFIIPFSVVGLLQSSVKEFDNADVLVGKSELEKYLRHGKFLSCKKHETCSKTIINSDSINSIFDHHLFAHAYFQQLSSLLPFWMEIGFSDFEVPFSDKNFRSSLLRGDQLKLIKPCRKMFAIDSDVFSVYTPQIRTSFEFLSVSKQIQDNVQLCYSINMCSKLVQIGLSKGELFSMADIFSSIGIYNFNASVKRFGIGHTIANVCHQFDDSTYCLQPDAYWDISGIYKSDSLSSEISFDGRLFTKFADIHKFPVDKFSANQRFMLKGKTTTKITMNMLGKKTKITSSSGNSSIMIDIGELDESCLACKKRGIKISMQSAESSFDSKLKGFHLSFLPKTNILLHIPLQLKGGKIIGVFNIRHLTRKFRLFIRIRSLISRIKVALGFKYLNVARLIDARFSPFYGLVTSFYELLKRYDTRYQDLFAELKKLKKSTINLEIVLRTLLRSLSNDSSKEKAVSLLKVVLFRLKRIRSTKIQPKNQPVDFKIQGQILTFEGSICIHQLCFKNLNFSLYDLEKSFNDMGTCKSCNDQLKHSNNEIIIHGNASSDVRISNKIEIIKGQELKIYINKTSNDIHGECDVFVTLRGGKHKGKIVFSNGRVSLEVHNVQVVGKIKMNVSKSERIEEVTWQSITSRLKGSTSGASEFAKSIGVQVQTYYDDVSSETKIRIDRAKANELSSYKRWEAKMIELQLLEKISDAADRKVYVDNLTLQKYLGKLNGTQFILNRYIPTLSSTFIERNMETMCKLRECKDTCITLPHCEICQEPVHVKVKILKCKKIKRTIRSLQTVTFNTNCVVKKYIFIPVYTGTCSEDPSMAALRQNQLKGSLINVGAGLGTLIGGPVGGLIGGIVGAFFSLFSSCDRSYKVVTKVRLLNMPCVKTRTKIKTTIIESSICSHVDKTVKTGYGEPKNCKCVVDPCFAKVKAPSCLISNENCHKLRLKSLQNTTNLPDPKYAKLYKETQKYKQLVEVQNIEVEASKKQQKLKNDEFKRAKNMIAHFKQDNEIAKRNHEDLKDILKTEICISSYHNKSNKIDYLMKINELTTEMKGNFVDNFKIVAKIFHISSNEIREVPLIFQTRDVDTSIKMAGKKIVNNILCPASVRRRRRLINDEDTININNDLSFASWLQDESKTLSVAEHACFSLQKSIKFLQEINTKLYLQMIQAESISEQIADTRFEMEMIEDDSNTNNQSVILATNSKVFTAISDSVNAEDNRNKPFEVIKQWLINSELYTKLNNLTICYGFVDCVNVAFRSIRELPRITDTSYKQLNEYIDKLQRLFNNLLTEQTMKFEELRFIVYETEQYLKQILSIDLHCSKAPAVAITPTEKQIDLVQGDLFKFKCNVTSTLPVEVFWKINDTIKDDIKGNELQIKATVFDAGMYACIARNAIGETSSDQIMLSINTSPHFIEQPKDFKFIKPAIDSLQPFFICNVSSIPNAEIEWFFIPFNEVQPVRLTTNSPILTIENATVSGAGIYFCRASNIHGVIQSSRARLDVLESHLASQMISLGFQVKSKQITEVNNQSFEDFIRKSKNTADIKLMFTRRDSETGNLELKIEKKFPELHYKSKDEMFNIAMKSRQELADAMASIMANLMNNNYSINTSDGKLLKVNKDSLYSSFLGNICKEGFVKADDGFSCYECQAGWYRGKSRKIKKCDVGTFQTKPGGKQCQKCQKSFITENTGATSSKECIKLEKAKIDIVFIIDSSRSTGYSNWNKIIKFIKYFVENYFSENSTRLMLMNYGDVIQIPIQLNQFPEKQTLIYRLLNHVYYMQGSSSKTNDALQLAYDTLKKAKTNKRKQIVAIFTDGQSSGLWYKSGFQMTKEKALKVRSDGIHVISIGVGFTIDTRELHAIASYPKIENTFQLNDFHGLMNGFMKSFRQFYSMSCSNLDLDIGFFVEKHDCMMENSPWSVIRSAILILPNSVKTKTKVSLFEYGSKNNKFMKFEHQYDYHTCFGYGRYDQRRKSNVKMMLRQSFNDDFTELRGSIARVKILLAFTKLPINPKDLKEINRIYPEEKIKFFNILIKQQEEYDIDDYEDDDDDNETLPNYLIRNNQINVLSKKLMELVTNENCNSLNK